MNKELWEKATRLAAQPYSVEVYRDDEASGEAVYLAKSTELVGCMGQGATIEDALSNLNEAIVDFIYSLLEDGLPVPAAIITATSTGGLTHTVPASSIIWQPSQESQAELAGMQAKGSSSEQRDLLYSYPAKHG
jgi:predicted RNase H-like HicB family nuclease